MTREKEVGCQPNTTMFSLPVRLVVKEFILPLITSRLVSTSFFRKVGVGLILGIRKFFSMSNSFLRMPLAKMF